MAVQGRLKTRVEFWTNTLQASSFVLEIVKSVYRLPFLTCMYEESQVSAGK